MKLPYIETCFQLHCVTDLPTGGLLLGFFELAIGIVLLIVIGLLGPKYLLLPVIHLAVSLCWLYGVEKSRPRFLLPNVVYCSVILGFLLLASLVAIIVMPCLIFTGSFEVKEVLLYTLFICFEAAIVLYLWISVYSVYNSLKRLVESEVAPNVRLDFLSTTVQIN